MNGTKYGSTASAEMVICTRLDLCSYDKDDGLNASELSLKSCPNNQEQFQMQLPVDM